MTINDELCAFSAILPFPHPIRKNTYKAHRTVVIPDYQGIGLSKILRNFIGEELKKNGKSFITTTSSLALIQSMKKDYNWRCTRIGRTSSGSGKIQNKNKKDSTSNARITTSWEYL